MKFFEINSDLSQKLLAVIFIFIATFPLLKGNYTVFIIFISLSLLSLLKNNIVYLGIHFISGFFAVLTPFAVLNPFLYGDIMAYESGWRGNYPLIYLYVIFFTVEIILLLLFFLSKKAKIN